MANYDLNDLFEQYYTQYRAEADVPNDEDDEYIIFKKMSKEAINRWSNYDATYWKELFVNSLDATDGTTVLSTGVSNYACPTNMKEAGGFVRIRNSVSGAVQSIYPIVEPQEAQFKADHTRYCYFTGNPSMGFTLHLSTDVAAQDNGNLLDYIYYKIPTFLANGADLTEMSDPMFIVHRVLANRFRSSRNPYYNSAKQDAEDVLRTMQADNNSGTWANPWTLADTSGTEWGR